MMLKMFDWEFKDPYFFLLFLVFIPMLLLDYKKTRNAIPVPSYNGMKSANVGWVFSFLKLTKYLILSFIIIALARPRKSFTLQESDDSKGIDIILSVDVSPSMLAKDLVPDRLTALKEIAHKFVDDRKNDRIGLVAYSGDAFAKVPLTVDKYAVTDQLLRLYPGELKPGTDVGRGLMASMNHLKNSKAKSKIVILMTDGVNSHPDPVPIDVAAGIAKNNNIKVYTVGIGSSGRAMAPVDVNINGELIFGEVKVEIDEPALNLIAETTGGKYFRATSNDRLEEVYSEINLLEKSEIEQPKRILYKEFFVYFLWVAFFVLFIDVFFRWKMFKTIN